MRVALIHYHLQGGGVTRVVWNQLKVLRDCGVDVVALIGQEPPSPLPAPYKVVPGLLYEALRPAWSAEKLAQELRAAVEESLGAPADIWHAHNHSLGKNLILPTALGLLARQGERLLLQVHDFAEDGRPANYHSMLTRMAANDPGALRRLLYPQGSHVHYAVLNSRDHVYLLHAGLDAAQLHLLPNPIGFSPAEQESRGQAVVKEPLWLYPTRAIRRKNIGEFLLWSALAPQEARFATTTGPENPQEWRRYRRWQGVAAELRLPVSFEEAGPGKNNFLHLMRSASCVVSTSVAEGFGMAFLEPWLLGTPVCGRDLPEITNSFREDGFMLPYTYERLDVPVEWLGFEAIREAAMEGLRRNLAAYGRGLEPDSEERLLAAWIQDDRVDFGRLNEEMQEKILRRLLRAKRKANDEVVFLRPARLPLPDDPQQLERAMENNHRILRTRYNLGQYGETLVGVYEGILRDRVDDRLGALDGRVLLDHFLAPERLSLLRVD